MEEPAKSFLIQAGRIAKKVKEEVPGLVREGTSILEVCDYVERRIVEEGGRPAFPCNVDINDVAAHYTAIPNDTTMIPSSALVKVDLGVELEGYIADTAITVSTSNFMQDMVEAAEACLKAAINIVRDGVRVREVGETVLNTARSLGFKPVKNLTGHEISRYNLHAGISVPNVPTMVGSKLKEGHVYAIEPFITLQDAAGEVIEGRDVTIFRADALTLRRAKLKGPYLELANELARRFKGLPYSPRWLSNLDKEALALHENLYRSGKIYGYHVLLEKSGKPVAQAEHTILVTSNGCIVIT